MKEETIPNELEQKKERLISVTTEMIEIVKRGDFVRFDLAVKSSKIACEILPFIEGVRDTEAFFNEIKVIDNKVLELETEMGLPIDFFNPHSFELLLEKLAMMRDASFQEFENELKSGPDINSRSIFWASRFRPHEIDRLELNWPAKVDTMHSFVCRLIARNLINQIKSLGLVIDEGTERVILNAMPFMSDGFGWQGEEDINKDVTREIEERQKQSLDIFFKLPLSAEISKIAYDMSRKFILLDSFRRSDEALSETVKLRKIDPELLDKDLKRIIRDAQKTKEWNGFFGHMLPYAMYSVMPLSIRPKESGESTEDKM